MAAIICSSFGDLCRGCGEVLSIPCQACGGCCSSLTEALGSPFLPYILVTLFLNVPPVLTAARALADGDSCSSALQWLGINALFCIGHVIACFHIVKKIREDTTAEEQHQHVVEATVVSQEPMKDDGNKMGSIGTKADKMESGTLYRNIAREMISKEDEAPHSTWGRIKNVLCYDKGVALYIVMIIFWIVWQTIGVSRYLTLLAGNNNNDDNGGCGSATGHFMTALFCSYAFLCLVGIAFCCSMCCLRL